MPRVANEHWISCTRLSLFRSPSSPKLYWRASAHVVFEAYDSNTALGGDAVVIDNRIAMRWLVATTKRKDPSYALSAREAVRHRSLRVVVPCIWVYGAAHVVAANPDASYGRIVEHSYRTEAAPSTTPTSDSP